MSSLIVLEHMRIMQEQQKALVGSVPHDLWLWLGPMSGLPMAWPSSLNLPEAGKTLRQIQHVIGSGVGVVESLSMVGSISGSGSLMVSFPVAVAEGMVSEGVTGGPFGVGPGGVGGLTSDGTSPLS